MNDKRNYPAGFISELKRRFRSALSLHRRGVASCRNDRDHPSCQEKTEKNPPGRRIAVANVHGIGGRDSQQDAFAVSNISDAPLCKSRGVLAVLADGMGGLNFGSEISGIVVGTMMEAFQRGDIPESPAEALMRLVRLADDKVAEFLSGHANASGGSTAVAVIIRNGELDYISVGDSRVCLIRDGRMETLSRAHNYGTELDELGRERAFTPKNTPPRIRTGTR
jgi:serine/threonine protein phosphatase PrpC